MSQGCSKRTRSGTLIGRPIDHISYATIGLVGLEGWAPTERRRTGSLRRATVRRPILKAGHGADASNSEAPAPARSASVRTFRAASDEITASDNTQFPCTTLPAQTIPVSDESLVLTATRGRPSPPLNLPAPNCTIPSPALPACPTLPPSVSTRLESLFRSFTRSNPGRVTASDGCRASARPLGPLPNLSAPVSLTGQTSGAG